MRAWLLLLPLLALAACVPAEPQPERLSPTARSACEARGGYVAIAGLSGAEFCAELLPDAGQSCARAGDCSGYCDARTRTCSTHADPFGCFSYLDENGQPGELCAD
ncbi:MAG: hypothetical protein KDJ98_19010 [Rhodobacteraceae bacterium]|nr:hypothetical protein [Paracoccaceae bacterium]